MDTKLAQFKTSIPACRRMWTAASTDSAWPASCAGQIASGAVRQLRGRTSFARCARRPTSPSCTTGGTTPTSESHSQPRLLDDSIFATPYQCRFITPNCTAWTPVFCATQATCACLCTPLIALQEDCSTFVTQQHMAPVIRRREWVMREALPSGGRARDVSTVELSCELTPVQRRRRASYFSPRRYHICHARSCHASAHDAEPNLIDSGTTSTWGGVFLAVHALSRCVRRADAGGGGSGGACGSALLTSQAAARPEVLVWIRRELEAVALESDVGIETVVAAAALQKAVGGALQKRRGGGAGGSANSEVGWQSSSMCVTGAPVEPGAAGVMSTALSLFLVTQQCSQHAMFPACTSSQAAVAVVEAAVEPYIFENAGRFAEELVDFAVSGRSIAAHDLATGMTGK